jgi:hypothetical protein
MAETEKRKPLTARLLLQAAERQPGDEVPVEEQEKEDHGERNQHASGRVVGPFSLKSAAQALKPQGQSVEGFGTDYDSCDHELGPGRHEREDRTGPPSGRLFDFEELALRIVADGTDVGRFTVHRVSAHRTDEYLALRKVLPRFHGLESIAV